MVWFYDKLDRDPEFCTAVEELRGETLGCWCVDTKDACHGEVIINYLHGGNVEDERSAPALQELCARGQMYVRDNHDGTLDGVRHGDVIEHLIDHGATEEQAETAVKKLRDRGDITVPAIDHYRA